MRSAIFEATRVLPLVVILLGSCGGPASSGPGAKAGHEGSDPGDGPGSPDSSGPQLPSCGDGSCVRCGDTICLPGYYCETNGGVTGCAWTGACAKEATCSCLRPQLASDPRCSCEDRDGWAFVTCSR